MNWKDIHSAYFIGIGGIGMSAIARWMHAKGISVAGYDRTPSSLTNALMEEGMDIHFEDKLELIPKKFLVKENTLIVFTPAIPSAHQELNHFQNKGFAVKKRSEVLGMITENHYTIAVAGTHGKTTTSSMIAHLLSDSEDGCSAFVGGIMSNTNSNLIIGNKDAPIVVEADEYDRSFMRLSPDFIIITSLDADHLDIYGDESGMLATYENFAKKIPDDGLLLVEKMATTKIDPSINYMTYGIKDGDVQADDLRIENGAFVFTYRCKTVTIKDIKLAFPGFHNVANALAAITVAIARGMDGKHIHRRIESYRGVKRRFEYLLKSEKITFIDDYAHHPAEIQAFLKSVRSLAMGRKITAIFQPHLFSRTNDFKKGFAEALDIADDVLLLEIYPAREVPIPGVTSKSIFDLMKNSNKEIVAKSDLLDALNKRPLEMVVTIGAGDIDREVPKIAAYLKEKYGNNVMEGIEDA